MEVKDIPGNEKEEFAETFGKLVIRYRWIILILCLVLGAAGTGGIQFIRFNNDYRYNFSSDNPQLNDFEALQNIYSKNDNILIALGTADGHVFTPQVLDAVAVLTEEAWRIPHATRVDSITNFQHVRADEDDLFVADLVENPLDLSAGELKRIKRIALAEPLLVNRLISRDASVTGINVTLCLPGKNSCEQTDAVKHTRKLVASVMERYPGLNIHMTGLVALDNAFFEASAHDMQTLVPAMYLIIIILTAVILRSVSGTIATLAVIVFSTLTSMGILGWTGIPMTSATANAPIMIMTLAVAGCIHILVSSFQEMRKGLDKNRSIVESCRVNLQPVFLTCFTTAAGFLSMNFSESPPFRDLGNITAIGVMVAFFYTVLLLPALASVLPFRVKERADTNFAGMMTKLILAWQKPILWGAAFLSIFLGCMIFNNELDDSWIEYFDESIPFRADTDFIHDNLTGIYQIEYSLGAGKSFGICGLDYLSTVDAFAGWWRARPGVVHVECFSDTVKRLNKNMHGNKPDQFILPGNQETAAQYLLLYEMSLPYGLDLNNRINIDKSSTRFTVTMKDSTMKEIRLAAVEGEKWLKDNAPGTMFSRGAGTAVMFSNISQRNIISMLKGTAVALVFISFTLMLALGSLKFGMLSLIPNLIPAVMAFGLWGLFSGRINLGISVVAAITLGIVVDDSVHFLSKYLRAVREYRLSPHGGIRYAFSSAGIAIIMTSVILSAGFMVLSFSNYYVTGSMGRLAAVTICIALVADFLLLPSILALIKAPGAETIDPYDHMPEYCPSPEWEMESEKESEKEVL